MSEDQSLGKQIQKSYFIALVKEAASVKAEVGTITGDFGERLKAAQDGSNLHLKAFRTICQMNRMEEQKRNAYRDCLMLYLDMADEELWGGQHVGDLDKMAREASAEDENEPGGDDTRITIEAGGRTVETTGSALSAAAESLRNARGISELSPEKHEANQKGKRGRAKTAAEKANAEDEALEAAEAEGLADWHARKPGAIPEKYADKPAEGQRWLDGWERGQTKAMRERDAENFDKNPPRGSATPGGDALGTYATH